MATIYTLQNPSPRNEVRDMSINQIFSGIVDGVRYTDYQLFIYKVSDNTLVYNSTKLALTPNLPDGATWQHTVPSGSVANSATETYKWKLQVWNGAETVTTREFAFSAKTTPVLTFSPPATVTTQSYNFTATIAQAQGDIPNTYTFYLYDSTQEEIESSGLITNFNIAHEFSGFANGDSLYVRVVGETTGGQIFDSGLVAFSVVYSEPDVNLKPEAVVDNEQGIITLSRGEVIQIIGTSMGTVSYDTSFPVAGMSGVDLADGTSYVSFDVSIPVNHNLWFNWLPDNGFTGKILWLDNGAVEVGYNGTNFYYEINGTLIDEPPMTITGKYFVINVAPTKVTFTEVVI